MRRSGVEIIVAAILLHMFFITHIAESQAKRGEIPSFGVIEKDPKTGTYRVKPPVNPPLAKTLKKPKFDYQRFEKELTFQKRLNAQHEEMEKQHHVQDQSMQDRRTKQLQSTAKLTKIKFLGKETGFYEGPHVSKKSVLMRSSTSMISNVQINGKQIDSIYADDPFTLTFSFAPNTISALVNIYADVNKNGIIDGDDMPVIENGIAFDNGQDDQNDASGQFKIELPKGNFYSEILSSLIFEVNNYQTISSAILTVKEKVGPRVIIGTIDPMFNNTIVSLQTYHWYRNVFPDSTGTFIIHEDTSSDNALFVNVGTLGKTPQGYLPPNDTNITLNKDTIRFARSYKVATEFIEGYIKDQFGDPINKGNIRISYYGLNVSAESDSSGYYKLGVRSGDNQIMFDPPTITDEYMHKNYQYNYVFIGQLQTIRKDAFFLKAQSSISGSINYGSFGVGGVPVSASNDSVYNQTYTTSNGNYSLKVFKPSNTNIPYYISTGIDDYGYYVDSSYRQNTPSGSTNINFEMKKVMGGLQGRVTDLYTGKPVKNAYFNFNGPAYRYAQTDDSGYYKVRMPEGKYSFSLSAQYYDYYNEYDVVVTNAFTTKNILLTRTGSFSGTITDESGKPVAEAYINARDSAGNYWGSYRYDNLENYVVSGLQTSYYNAQVVASGFIPQWYDKKLTVEDATSFKVTRGYDTPNINFILSRGGSISGIVKDKNGAGIPNIFMVAYDTSFYNSWYARTDDSGKYTITGLQSGKYYVATYGNDYVDQWYDGTSNYFNAAQISVIIYQNTPNINFTLSKGGSIYGKVSDKQGHPIANAEVVTVDTNSYFLLYAHANDSGLYEFKKITPGKKIFAVARAQGFSRRWYDNATSFETATPLLFTNEEKKENINFALPVSGKISGTVKNKSGTPIQGASIHAESGNDFNFHYTNSDQFGNYLIDNLDGGKYLVAASSLDYAEQWYNHQSLMFLADSVFVIEETTTPNINFDLTTGGKITGTVKNISGTPVQYAFVSISKLDGSAGYNVNSDEQGTYTINNVQPGKYFASVSHYEYIQQWYNHKSIISLADTISIDGEVIISNIDFDLKPIPPPSNDSILIKVTMNNIPDTLVFNKTGLNDNEVDYWWGVRLNVDNDGTTGPPVGHGCEIELVAFHYKIPNAPEYKSNLVDGTYHVLIEWDINNGYWRHSDVSVSIDKSDKNTIVIKAPKDWIELYQITSATKYYIHTFAHLDNKQGSDDTDLKNRFAPLTDNKNDAAFDFIDILSATPSIITGVEGMSRSTVPTTNSLGQNFPNPFNPNTTISFDLPKQEKVSLKVYNIVGQEVATLVNEVRQAGSYNEKWSGVHLASGIYFYTLRTESFSQTKKMILLK